MNNPYMDLLAELTGPEDDWLKEAECRNHDPELWFTDGKDDKGNRLKVAQAQSICHTCPVQVQCLQWATDTRQQYGVWGGEKRIEPKVPHRKRPTCKQGHEWTPETEYHDRNGQRRCVICRREQSARAARAKREKRHASRKQVSA